MPDPEQPPRRRWRRPIVLVSIVVVIAGLIATLIPGGCSVPSQLPDPNGYDDFVKASNQIHGDWPNKGDYAKAKIDEIRPFVEANKASLDLVKIGLKRESLVPIEDSQEGLARHFEASRNIRSVPRLLICEAMVYEADGRFVEAARSYRDVLELGQALTQGGLGNDVTVGYVIQGQAIARLRAIANQLPSDTIREIIAELGSLEQRRLSLDAIEARRVRWYRGSFSRFERMMLSTTGMAKQGQAAEQQMIKKALANVDRPLRYLQVQLAIHAFHEDQKAWPRSVEELIPEYLSTVPIDPTTGKPLEYPANPNGELTDDLGTIARPDGQVKPQP
jgi:hypothetical protein